MARKGSMASYMSSMERILGGILLVVYLLVLPFVTRPLFALLGRMIGTPIPPSLQNSIYYYVLFALTLLTFWNYIGRTTTRFISIPWHTLGTVCLGLIGFYGLNELTFRVMRLISSGQVNLNDVAISAQVHDAPRSTILIVVFLAPFVEEVLFRGYVFGNIRERSRWAAYLVSCLLFAFLHVWQFAVVEHSLTYFLLMLQYLAPGLVLAWAYERSSTLWGSILLHSIVNGLAVWQIL